MPLHPAIVHLPLALTFLLPVLVLVFAWAIKAGKMSKEMWLVIIGLQVLVTATGYISLETGETDEEKVSVIVGKDVIHQHEEAAEVLRRPRAGRTGEAAADGHDAAGVVADAGDDVA